MVLRQGAFYIIFLTFESKQRLECQIVLSFCALSLSIINLLVNQDIGGEFCLYNGSQ